MFHRLILALPLLSLAFLALASPLQQREPTPGLIEDLLNGKLPEIAQLIKDVLFGVKSAIDNNKWKPPICPAFIDVCCPCTIPSITTTKHH